MNFQVHWRFLTAKVKSREYLFFNNSQNIPQQKFLFACLSSNKVSVYYIPGLSWPCKHFSEVQFYIASRNKFFVKMLLKPVSMPKMGEIPQPPKVIPESPDPLIDELLILIQLSLHQLKNIELYKGAFTNYVDKTR